MARTGGEGAKGVSAFLVPTDTPGFSPKPIHGKLGLRSCDTAEISLDGVRVSADALLGPEGAGLKVSLGGLDDGRISLGASCVGLGQAALDAMTSYVGQREQFGRPIASFQLVQELIADTAVEVEAARMLVWRAADLKRRGENYTVAASMAKYYASECSVRAANAAVQVHGGYGYVDEFVVGKLLRDARVTTLYEGTSQVQKLLIGRALTGVSAFT
jgi:alkylation response protein AidB-like acyl-CoA dehydrogenase